MAVRDWPFSTLVTVTVTPGTAAPCSSVTVPTTLPFIVCARAGAVKAKTHASIATSGSSLFLIMVLTPTLSLLNVLKSYPRLIWILDGLGRKGNRRLAAPLPQLTGLTRPNEQALCRLRPRRG